MLNLYNIYKNLILESTEIDVVMDAINKHYYVNIMYDGKTPNIRRYCQVYNFGKTSRANDTIRVFQVFGPGERGWKMFRLDKIIKWEPTQMTFPQPVSNMDSSIPEFKPHDKNLSYGNTVIAQFDKK